MYSFDCYLTFQIKEILLIKLENDAQISMIITIFGLCATFGKLVFGYIIKYKIDWFMTTSNSVPYFQPFYFLIWLSLFASTYSLALTNICSLSSIYCKEYAKEDWAVLKLLVLLTCLVVWACNCILTKASVSIWQGSIQLLLARYSWKCSAINWYLASIQSTILFHFC